MGEVGHRDQLIICQSRLSENALYVRIFQNRDCDVPHRALSATTFSGYFYFDTFCILLYFKILYFAVMCCLVVIKNE